MKAKASLHLHSSEDLEDGIIIGYDLFGLIDHAAVLGFQALASTCHDHGVCRPEHIEYAKKKGILLIPGVEQNISGRRHVVILNGGADADNVRTFEGLKAFRLAHPEAFILAVHPNHRFKSSITLDKLKEHRAVFDAAEHSWFYSSRLNPNLQTEQLCAESKLPFVATADAHTLEFLNTDYAVLDVAELTPAGVFQAIRANKFENFTRAKTIRELAGFLVFLCYGELLSLLWKKR